MGSWSVQDVDLVPHANAVGAEEALRHFQGGGVGDTSRILRAAIGIVGGAGKHLAYRADFAGLADIGNVQRDEGAVHPEGGFRRARFLIDEQHAVVRRQGFAAHQALAALGIGDRQFGRHRFLAVAGFDTELRLIEFCRGFGRRPTGLQAGDDRHDGRGGEESSATHQLLSR